VDRLSGLGVIGYGEVSDDSLPTQDDSVDRLSVLSQGLELVSERFRRRDHEHGVFSTSEINNDVRGHDRRLSNQHEFIRIPRPREDTTRRRSIKRRLRGHRDHSDRVV
jgi:hypothetical protein